MGIEHHQTVVPTLRSTSYAAQEGVVLHLEIGGSFTQASQARQGRLLKMPSRLTRSLV